MEIVNENIIEFISTGKLRNMSLGDSKEQVFSFYGNPDYIETYKAGTYYHFKNIRTLFYEDKLEEITILFKYKEFKYSIKEYNEQLDTELISSDFRLHSMLCLLNYLKLDWYIDTQYQIYDYCHIIVKNKVSVIYYLYDGTLERIDVNANVLHKQLPA